MKKDEISLRKLKEISNHAEKLCYLCAFLEQERRKGHDLGTIPAKAISVQVDAEKFYKNACGKMYQELSQEKLNHIINVTKDKQ